MRTRACERAWTRCPERGDLGRGDAEGHPSVGIDSEEQRPCWMLAAHPRS